MIYITEIQQDILNSNVQLSSILRKAKVFAFQLKNHDFSNWVENELNGYKLKELEDLPNYRIVRTQSFGHFTGPFGSGLRNAPIPTIGLSEEIQKMANKIYFIQSIRELESMIETGQDHFQLAWPANVIPIIADKIIEDMILMQAWRLVSKEQVVGVVDTVRNRLLTFILELNELDPSLSGNTQASKKLPVNKVTQIFNNYILGNNNIVGSGSEFAQNVIQIINEGDFKSLQKQLLSNKVSESDIAALHIALNNDGKRTKSDGFGENVKKWIGTMIQKVLSGVWDIAIEVAPIILANSISAYYGWK